MADTPGLLDAGNSYFSSPSGLAYQSGSVGLNGLSPRRTGQGRSPVVQRLLDQTYNTAVGLAQNPVTQVTGTTKSQEAGGRISNLYTDYDKNKATKDQSIEEFVNELIAQKPKNRAAMQAEQNSIGRVYGTGPGSLAGDLAAAGTQRRQAVRAAAASALNRAKRSNNASRMVSGNNSYLDRAYGDALARIMSQQALDGSATTRDDILQVQGQRNALLGQSQNAADRFAASLVQPVDVLNRYAQGQSGELSRISDLENNNTYYDYMTPEQQVAMRLGLIDQIQGIEDQSTPVNYNPGGVLPALPTRQQFKTPGQSFSLPGPYTTKTMSGVWDPQYVTAWRPNY